VTTGLPEHLPRFLFALAITMIFAMPASTWALEPVAYEAVYDVYMDGKRRMENRISASRDGDQWVLRHDGKGIKGLARFLNARSSETGSIHWREGTIEPLTFSHHSKVAGRDDRWSADFDWSRGVVDTVHEDGESSLELPAGTTDPLSVNLLLRQSLEQGLESLRIKVVDEDEIDEHVYVAGSRDSLQTALGCLEVVPLERVRENSKRFSKGWYAPSLEFIPVRIQHGKRGEREFDMRIRQLTLAGQAVEKQADCP
jgi:hypothetical protein